MFNTNNEVVGVAFSGLDHADGIGYMVPARTVLHFLEGVQLPGRAPSLSRPVSLTSRRARVQIFAATMASLAASVRSGSRSRRWRIVRCAWRVPCPTR